jgi:hypothetical protein
VGRTSVEAVGGAVEAVREDSVVLGEAADAEERARVTWTRRRLGRRSARILRWTRRWLVRRGRCRRSLPSFLSLSLLFSESVVSPSLKQAHRAGSSSEETTSSSEEEESLLSSLSSPNARHLFDIAVDTSSSSLAYLRLFSFEAIWDSSAELTQLWNSKNNHQYILSPQRAFQEA